MGDPDDSNEPRGLGVCTSRARPGHGTRPRQLVCWVGQCRSRYQHGLFSRAGDTEPVYQTCDTVLSTLATWAVVLRQPHNRVLQKKKIFCGTQGSTHTPATGRSQDRTDHPSCRVGQVSQTPGPPPAGSRGSCHRYWELRIRPGRHCKHAADTVRRIFVFQCRESFSTAFTRLAFLFLSCFILSSDVSQKHDRQNLQPSRRDKFYLFFG